MQCNQARLEIEQCSTQDTVPTARSHPRTPTAPQSPRPICEIFAHPYRTLRLEFLCPSCEHQRESLLYDIAEYQTPQWDDCMWKVNYGMKDYLAKEARESLFQQEIDALLTQLKEAHERLAVLEGLSTDEPLEVRREERLRESTAALKLQVHPATSSHRKSDSIERKDSFMSLTESKPLGWE